MPYDDEDEDVVWEEAPRMSEANGPADGPTRASGSIGDGAREPVPDESVITPDDIESELENLQSDLAKTNDRYLRLAAEFAERTLPDKHQVGLRDPDDIVVNLNFPLSEVQ